MGYSYGYFSAGGPLDISADNVSLPKEAGKHALSEDLLRKEVVEMLQQRAACCASSTT